MEESGIRVDATAAPLILPRSEHPISRRDIDPDALKILFRLHRLGFIAYLTGGAVRDMLLGKAPKDFDIATSAHPAQIKKYFGNAFIIGRRFRLAHIRFRGGKVVEVATFRKDPGPAAVSAVPSSGTAFAAVERAPSYAFGTPEEDARRRDITVNALFYDPVAATVIDFVGGVADLRRGRIRVIGDARERFREDPVRIWRAVRYAARLGFAIDDDVGAAIRELRGLLTTCSEARLFEEFSKDLLGPRSRAVIALEADYGVLSLLLGRIGALIETDPAAAARVAGLLEVADREKSLRGVGLGEAACLLFWPWAEPLLAAAGPEPFPVLKRAFLESGMAVALPKGLRAHLIEVLALIARMERALRDGVMRWSIRGRPHYDLASWLFFVVRQGRAPAAGESFESLYRQAFPDRPPSAGGRSRRPRRRRRRPAAQ
jgi:poly(A) polymerase